MVAELGLEPRLSGSEPLVLPLHHSADKGEKVAPKPDVIKKVSEKNVL